MGADTCNTGGINNTQVLLGGCEVVIATIPHRKLQGLNTEEGTGHAAAKRHRRGGGWAEGAFDASEESTHNCSFIHQGPPTTGTCLHRRVANACIYACQHVHGHICARVQSETFTVSTLTHYLSPLHSSAYHFSDDDIVGPERACNVHSILLDSPYILNAGYRGQDQVAARCEKARSLDNALPTVSLGGGGINRNRSKGNTYQLVRRPYGRIHTSIY